MPKNKLLGIFLAGIMLLGFAPMGYSESLKNQLYQGVVLPELSCNNENHILALQHNGKPVCVTEKNAIKVGWTIFYDDSVYVDYDGTLECYTWVMGSFQYNITKEIDCNGMFDDINSVKCTDFFYEKYELVEPLDVIVSNGEFSHLCVEKDFKWFEIYVDGMAGSTTITIPKSIVDLKQFDYPVCNEPYDFIAVNDRGDDVPVTVQQISNTADSRTLQFTYLDDVSKIYYFGVSSDSFYNGVILAQPNHCIYLVESGEMEADPVKKEKTMDEMYDSECDEYDTVELNHSITNGEIEKICGSELPSYFYIKLKDVDHDSTLIIDIPYSMNTSIDDVYYWDDTAVALPLVTDDYNEHVTVIGTDIYDDGFDGEYRVVRQCQDYQTFELDLIANTEWLEILHVTTYGGGDEVYHNENMKHPLLEIQDNCKPTKKVNVDEMEPVPVKKEKKSMDERFEMICEEFDIVVELNHSITSGEIEKICGSDLPSSFDIKFKNVNSDATLIIDVPYTMNTSIDDTYYWDDNVVSLPLVVDGYDQRVTVFVDTKYEQHIIYNYKYPDSHNSESYNEKFSVIRQCQDYQTLEFDLPSDIEFLEIYHETYPVDSNYLFHNENMKHPLLEIQDNCKPTKKENVKNEYFDSMCENYDGKIHNDIDELVGITNNLVEYEITGGELLNISHDKHGFNIVIFIDATEDGSLTVTIPSSVMDKAFDDAVGDGDLYVLINGEEEDFDETSSSTYTTITTEFQECVKEIEIIGHYYHP